MSKADRSMREWRDYYEKLRARAEDNFQHSGISRYDREEYKYSVIVDAFNGYLEHKDEADNEKLRRQNNIDAYCENHLYKDTYTLAEVKSIINVIRDF